MLSCSLWYCGCTCLDGVTLGTCSGSPGSCPGDCESTCLSIRRVGSINSCNRYDPNTFQSQCMYLQTPASVPCPSGYTSCSGRCVYTSTDSNNCGGCGTSCNGDGSTACANGSCTAVSKTAPYRRAFITSTAYSITGTTPDSQCMSEASAAGLTGTYRAVLASTSSGITTYVV